jgi:glycerol uptake facilitator-like aquaporin
MQVNLCMAVFGDFPWKKVPEYVLPKIIGAWLEAIIVFANYFHAINIFEGQKGRRTGTSQDRLTFCYLCSSSRATVAA